MNSIGFDRNAARVAFNGGAPPAKLSKQNANNRLASVNPRHIIMMVVSYTSRWAASYQRWCRERIRKPLLSIHWSTKRNCTELELSPPPKIDIAAWIRI